ncbi:MAG: alkaline phosphatase [Candidatus Kapabacteria bacterium]|nr:alkaline phosphatase [Candidatus Kapabacteria bacterium]
MKNIFRAILLILIVFNVATGQTKKNVIFFVADGCGIAPKTALRLALGQGSDQSRLSTDPKFQILAQDKLKFTATITNHSLNSLITDSAPGASVFASGKQGKIDNEFLSLDPISLEAIPTILEEAKKQGYAVGLVSTARVTHATPAAFASHIWNRDLEDYIACQLISKSQKEYEKIFNTSSNPDFHYKAEWDWILPSPKIGVEVDVMLGGGASKFLPTNQNNPNLIIKDKNGNPIIKNGSEAKFKGGRKDEVDLVEIAKKRGFVYLNSRDALLGLDLSQFEPNNNKKLLGLFDDSHMQYEQDRQLFYDEQPMLAEMTKIAIEVLKRKSKKGFFLLVESGRIDHLAHANVGGVDISEDGQNYIVGSDKKPKLNIGSYASEKDTPENIYGSDYFLKEVLAYDYSVEEARKFMNDKKNGETLIIATADHETGGFAIVGLYDKDKNNVRSYAHEPKKENFNPVPKDIKRGDSETKGFFPNYDLVDFQGWKWPQVSKDGRRIVIAYASNPLTNGNGTSVKNSAGNHTASDLLVLADDNVGGKFASKISGRGLLDNTDLTPIIEDFLGVKIPLLPRHKNK